MKFEGGCGVSRTLLAATPDAILFFTPASARPKPPMGSLVILNPKRKPPTK